MPIAMRLSRLGMESSRFILTLLATGFARVGVPREIAETATDAPAGGPD